MVAIYDRRTLKILVTHVTVLKLFTLDMICVPTKCAWLLSMKSVFLIPFSFETFLAISIENIGNDVGANRHFYN